MRHHWHHMISIRDYHPDRDRTDPHEGLSPILLTLIHEEASPHGRLIEIGCGAGRLTRAVAPRFHEVIALDWSEAALAKARVAVAQDGVANVHFHLADAEQIDYQALAEGPVPLVVAHLCMSNAIIAQAARLGPGTLLAFAAFHTDQWHETGVISRFAYSEAAVEEALAKSGFHPRYLGLEKDVLRFPSPEVAIAYLKQTGLEARWRSSDRWGGFLRFLENGGNSLTVRARVVVKARLD
ncbi:MAG: class I SAM-dependent methyltransferase [Candidatus Methylomirabilales bacterium]